MTNNESDNLATIAALQEHIDDINRDRKRLKEEVIRKQVANDVLKMRVDVFSRHAEKCYRMVAFIAAFENHIQGVDSWWNIRHDWNELKAKHMTESEAVDDE